MNSEAIFPNSLLQYCLILSTSRIASIIFSLELCSRVCTATHNMHQHNRIQKFTKEGRFLSGFGSAGHGDGQFNLPWGLTVDAQGEIYVADWRNDRIQKLDSNGKFIAQWGSSGEGEGQFNRPAAVAVDNDGNMYVADWGNERVKACWLFATWTRWRWFGLRFQWTSCCRATPTSACPSITKSIVSFMNATRPWGCWFRNPASTRSSFDEHRWTSWGSCLMRW